MTVSTVPISTRPISVLPAGINFGRVLPWKGDLELSAQETIVLAVINYWESNETKKVRVATHGWATRPTESPANTIIPGRLIPGSVVTQDLPLGEAGNYGGIMGRTLGEIRIANNDGVFDSYASTVVDGRQVVLYMAPMVEIGQSYTLPGGGVGVAAQRQIPLLEDFNEVFQSYGDTWEHDRLELRLTMQDAGAALRNPLQRFRYLGTGGAEGPEELKDRTKPCCFGYVNNIAPVLISSVYLIWQVHQGAITSVDAVYDRGAALEEAEALDVTMWDALVAAYVAPGYFTYAPSLGMIKLGSPPAGQVTADVHGSEGGEFLSSSEPWDDGTLFDDGLGWGERSLPLLTGSTIAAIVSNVLVYGVGWTSANVSLESFLIADGELPGRAGLYVQAGYEVTTEDAISQLCAPVGLVAGTDRTGKYALIRVKAPATSTPIIFNERTILELIREPLPWRVPPRAWTVGYARNWTIQRDADLAGAVTAERRLVLSEEFRRATASDLSIRTAHPTSRESPVLGTALLEYDDAIELARELLEFYGPGRAMYRVKVKRNFAVELGETVMLVHSRYGMTDGVKVVVVGVYPDLGSNTTEFRGVG